MNSIKKRIPNSKIIWIFLIFITTFLCGCGGQYKVKNRIKNNDNIKVDSQEQCPLIPFVAITGKPTKEQIEQFLNNFKRVDIQQFVIYARSGLEIEYMSKEWMDLCGYMIDYAAENGMSVWLYDDYNWPSGRCNCKVVSQNPDFAVKKILVWGDYDPMGKKIGNHKIKREYFWTISSVPLYTNLFNAKAVKTFIKLTHEKYYKRFKKYFGTVIKGFFTDEPSPGYAANGHPTKNSLLELPYWDELEKEYYQYTKRNFKQDVESFLNGNTSSEVWQDYYYLYEKKFSFSYLTQVRKWCENHNVALTGHLMSESWPESSIKSSGNIIKAMESYSIPGVDNIITWTTIEKMEWSTMKEVESAINITKKGGSAELFALGPCDITLGKMRQMIWITAIHGINHYFLAMTPLDTRGNIEKALYYMTTSTSQPWFDALKELGEDAKKAALYASKKSIKKIAVRYPQKLTTSTMYLSKKEKPVYNMPNLLQKLINLQWNPMLIADDDSCISEYKAVLSITKKGIKEEKSGKDFFSMEELSSWLEGNLQRSATVENEEGKRLENVFVKSYKDGSVCVVSLLDKTQGKVLLKQPGKESVTFELPEYGVYTYSPGQSVSVENVEKELQFNVNELLPYKLTSKNTMRLVFNESGICKIKIAKNIEVLSIAVRNYGDTVRVKLDGEKLKTKNLCGFLPDGFKALYLESEKFSLNAGTNILSLEKESHDYPYFPSAVICGNFGEKENNVLDKLPELISIAEYRNQGLKDYFGIISFNKKMETGKYKYLSMDTNGLVTELFINGESIGKKTWAPFRWKIPQNYRNKKIDMEIKIWTSVGPLFGDYPRKLFKGDFFEKFAPR